MNGQCRGLEIISTIVMWLYEKYEHKLIFKTCIVQINSIFGDTEDRF